MVEVRRLLQFRSCVPRLVGWSWLALVSVIFLAACFAPKAGNVWEEPAVKPVEVSQRDSAEYPPLQREWTPPLTIQRPLVWVAPAEKAVEPLNLPTPVYPDTAAPRKPVSAGEGFRVQVFAGHEQAAAHRTSEQVATATPFRVYLSYEAPQYKVRIGDFLTRGEADEWCERLKRQGYTGSWVVKTIVNQQ